MEQPDLYKRTTSNKIAEMDQIKITEQSDQKKIAEQVKLQLDKRETTNMIE